MCCTSERPTDPSKEADYRAERLRNALDSDGRRSSDRRFRGQRTTSRFPTWLSSCPRASAANARPAHSSVPSLLGCSGGSCNGGACPADLGRAGSRACDTLHAVLRLVEITAENVNEVARLRVSHAQESYIDGVADSLDEAAASPEAGPWYRAVYVEDTPVGFVMLSICDPPTDERYPFRYFLWRLLIDERFQGRGYGTETIDAVIAELRTRPRADVLFTSAVPGASPVGFYEHYGFVRTGEIFDDEIILRLDIERETGRRSPL